MTPWDDLVQRIEKIEQSVQEQIEESKNHLVLLGKMNDQVLTTWQQASDNHKAIQHILTALEELGKQVKLLEQKYDEDVQTLIKAIEFLQEGKV